MALQMTITTDSNVAVSNAYHRIEIIHYDRSLGTTATAVVATYVNSAAVGRYPAVHTFEFTFNMGIGPSDRNPLVQAYTALAALDGRQSSAEGKGLDWTGASDV